MLDFNITITLQNIVVASTFNRNIIIDLLSNVISKNIFKLYYLQIMQQIRYCELDIIFQIKNVTIDFLQNVSETFLIEIFKNKYLDKIIELC